MPDKVSLDISSDSISKLQTALEMADAVTQDAESAISAMTDAIKALLLQPDSGQMRTAIASLAEQIKCRIVDASDSINADAEQLGCNYINERERDLSSQLYKAARGASIHAGEQHGH